MVNRHDAASSRIRPKASPQLTVRTNDAHILRKTKFDGTKLPLVVLTSRNH
jgi:hypothetical protein